MSQLTIKQVTLKGGMQVAKILQKFWMRQHIEAQTPCDHRQVGFLQTFHGRFDTFLRGIQGQHLRRALRQDDGTLTKAAANLQDAIAIMWTTLGKLPEITWCLQPPLLGNHLDRWTKADPWDPHEVILVSSPCRFRQGNRSWQDVLLMSSSNSVLWSVESTKGLENWGQTGYHPNEYMYVCLCMYMRVCLNIYITRFCPLVSKWRLAKGIACELYSLSVTIPWACGMP